VEEKADDLLESSGVVGVEIAKALEIHMDFLV